MRTLLKTTLLVAVVSGLALAETYTGRLVDATCAARQKNAACTPTALTTSFALVASGKTLKFDSAGDQKAAAAVKQNENGANRSKNPNAPATTGITASVMGTMSGNVLKVESIKIE